MRVLQERSGPAAGLTMKPASGSGRYCIRLSRVFTSARLRLLAVFSSQCVPIGICDIQGLDGARRELLSDWRRALLAA
jgi:hypothetical protein